MHSTLEEGETQQMFTKHKTAKKNERKCVFFVESFWRKSRKQQQQKTTTTENKRRAKGMQISHVQIHTSIRYRQQQQQQQLRLLSFASQVIILNKMNERRGDERPERRDHCRRSPIESGSLKRRKKEEK